MGSENIADIEYKFVGFARNQLLKLGDEEWSGDVEDKLGYMLSHFNAEIRCTWRIVSKLMMQKYGLRSRLELTALLAEIFAAFKMNYEDRREDALLEVAGKTKEIVAALEQPVNSDRLIESYEKRPSVYHKSIYYHFTTIDYDRYHRILSTLKELIDLAQTNHRPLLTKPRTIDPILFATFNVEYYWCERWGKKFSQSFHKENNQFYPANASSEFTYEMIVFAHRIIAVLDGKSSHAFSSYYPANGKKLPHDGALASSIKNLMSKVISEQKKNRKNVK